MATINLGKVAPVYKGVYNSGTTYNKFEVVFDGESSFISLVDNNIIPLEADEINWIYLCKGNYLATQEIEEIEESSLLGASESLNQLFGRIQAIETFLKNAVFDTLQVDTLNVKENLNMFKLSNLIKIGTPRLIDFDLTTGGSFTITTGGVTTAPIVYTNTSTFASITTQITDALTAIGKTVALGYQAINGTTYILLRRDYDGLTGYDYTITDASGKIKKTASPLLEPDFIGQFFIDNTSTPAVSWQAVNTTSVSDWKQITN